MGVEEEGECLGRGGLVVKKGSHSAGSYMDTRGQVFPETLE